MIHLTLVTGEVDATKNLRSCRAHDEQRNTNKLQVTMHTVVTVTYKVTWSVENMIEIITHNIDSKIIVIKVL